MWIVFTNLRAMSTLLSTFSALVALHTFSLRGFEAIFAEIEQVVRSVN